MFSEEYPSGSLSPPSGLDFAENPWLVVGCEMV